MRTSPRSARQEARPALRVVQSASPADRRILVIVADASFRETVVRLLALDGFEARGTVERQEALACLETGDFGLVLCEESETGTEGGGLPAHLRRERPEIGVVLLVSEERAEQAHLHVPALADDLLLKPRCRDDLRLTIHRALAQARLRSENRELRESLDLEGERHVRELSRSVRSVERAYRLALESLVAALDAREGETHRHSRRVAEYAGRLADALGVSEGEKRDMFHGALLHDLGKIGIPDSILLKPAPLTNDEWRIMRSHPRLGYNIVRGLPGLRAAAECVIGHHERWDGGGYPLGFAGEELPRAARVVAVADAIDAMSVRRPYRDPLPFDRFVAELVQNRGTQFDPEVVDVALQLFRGWGDLHPDAQAWREVAESAASHARFEPPAREAA